MRYRLRLLAVGIITTSLVSPAPAIADSHQCQPRIAEIVSVQGQVDVRKAGKLQWQPASLKDVYCPGDTIRVRAQSRAALVLVNDTILRLDQQTTVTLIEPKEEKTSWLDLLTGIVHFFSRVPRTLRVDTPFVNAAVEGTEFLIKVEKDQATLTVFEGAVAASNKAGSLLLTAGQSAVAMMDEAPKILTAVRPRDAVRWALYYPAIVEYRAADFPDVAETGWPAMVRRSIDFYRKGDLAGAFSSIAEVPEDVQDVRFFTYRAALLLTVGRVDDARTDIDKALNLAPNNSHGLAVQAIIAMVQNSKDKAFDLAVKAVALGPNSAAARVALSYAQQANFDLPGALSNVQEAVNLRPDDALVRARLSELWLSLGYLDNALESAAAAASLNPNLARAQTVLGFAYLTQIKVRAAQKTFEQAITLDDAAPLPRLGLGLAKIRQNKLEAGRREIEIALSLDPNNALVRSYLGKAYYEEKRDTLAHDQFATAKELDPNDPTSWFYDAIRKQTENQPVRALRDLEKSIELNDNRAVYRSRLLLDEDLAARSASLGRIYRDLGFEQLALVEGWKSVNIDPSSHSAHRFLADSYSVLPRHEIARVSELLQAQLLQPININPIQPQLAESNLGILDGAGPSAPSFNEFNPLFTRNGFSFQANGIGGANDTSGGDLVLAGVQDNVSFSIGQFHFETDGFRENNDLEHDIHSLFAQINLSHKSSIQAEYRSKETEHGDLELDVAGFSTQDRKDIELETRRFGYHHTITPRSDLLVSFISQDKEETGTAPMTTFITEPEADQAEIQYLFSGNSFNLVTGAGSYDEDSQIDITIVPFNITMTQPTDVKHENAYLYAYVKPSPKTLLTVGVNFDDVESDVLSRNQSNPKLGLTWNPTPSTTLRLAAFRTLKRVIAANQSVEPTHVAGFNQFFDDGNGTDAKRTGIALDHKFTPRLFAGLESSRREMDVPIVNVGEDEQDEWLQRAYVFWIPHHTLSVGLEYLREKFDRELQLTEPSELETRRFPLTLTYHHPIGFFLKLKTTHVDQEVTIGSPVAKFEDDFWVTDLSIGYRFPKRRGLVSLDIRNLSDKEFAFQDRTFQTTEIRSPEFQPERTVFTKFTLAF